MANNSRNMVQNDAAGIRERAHSRPRRLVRIDSENELSFPPPPPPKGPVVATTAAAAVQAPDEDESDLSLLRGGSTSSSLMRRLTTYWRQPKTRSTSPSGGATSVSRFASLRRGRGYANIDERERDEADLGAVDISSLEGWGFEMRPFHQSPAQTPSLSEQDTAYQSPVSTPSIGTSRSVPRSSSGAPDFQTYMARRRAIGDGLQNAIQLKKNSSVNHGSGSADAPLTSAEIIKRSRTVRNIGQNLAEERKTIVAVSEIVDLGLLEGGQTVRRTGTATFDDLGLNRADTFGLNHESYFFPKDPEVPNWKPVTMSSFYILFLTLSALALAGVQEWLCQWSLREERQDGGILTFNEVSDVSVGAFFAWKYMPTMITIVFAVLFSIMDFEIRRLEPYYQLSQPNGSTAAASLNLDHLTTFQYFVPFNALRLKQWTVFFSTIGNIIASTVCPALQNPSVDFGNNTSDGCGTPSGCNNGTKNFFVRIDPIWSRLLTSSYIIIAVITVILYFQLRRKSGLLSDPKGIAGIASMAVKSHILQDFKGLDLATRDKIHKRLANRRFVLYQSSIWQGEWMPKSEPFVESENQMQSPHPPMLRIAAGIPFVAVMVIILIMVPIISLVRAANVIPNKLPWLPILIATLLKLVWTTFEADVRLMEPFYQLSKGKAKPEHSLTLDYQAKVYGLMPFIAAYNRHWLVAVVGLCSVFLDVFSVTVGSFNVNSQIFLSSINTNQDQSAGSETTVSFWTSVALSMSILIFVILVTVLVYMRRRHPFLPREPSTIAAVLAFIYSSKMLDEFVGTERMTSKQLENKLKLSGKTYGLGWVIGRDGRHHCAIDVEPIQSKYEMNKRYGEAIMTGPEGGFFNA